MATLHQGEDVARTVAAVGLVPVRPVLHRRVSRGLRDDPLLRSALDPGQWRRDAGWRGLGRAAARTYRLGRAALQSRPDAREIFRRSEEHASELPSLMRISYAVFRLKKKNKPSTNIT